MELDYKDINFCCNKVEDEMLSKIFKKERKKLDQTENLKLTSFWSVYAKYLLSTCKAFI